MIENIMRLFWFFIITFLVYSCQPEYKKCKIRTDDKALKIYNDVLNEIIIKGSYKLYLGKDEEAIFKRYASNFNDSIGLAEINKDVIRLHNKLFGDTARYCTIYLDTLMQHSFRPFVSYEKDSIRYAREFFSLIDGFSSNGQISIDSLNTVQKRYFSQDFQSCVAKIESITKDSRAKDKCSIGKIALSKIVLNKAADRGLVYCEFRCGELCGYGKIMIIGKVQDDWEIKESFLIWIS